MRKGPGGRTKVRVPRTFPQYWRLLWASLAARAARPAFAHSLHPTALLGAQLTQVLALGVGQQPLGTRIGGGVAKPPLLHLRTHPFHPARAESRADSRVSAGRADARIESRTGAMRAIAARRSVKTTRSIESS